MDVRRLQDSGDSRLPPRLDRVEPETAVLVGRSAAKSVKVRIDDLLLQVVAMIISAVGVRLPDFHHCVIDRSPVPVHDSSPHDTLLATTFASSNLFISD